MTTVSKLMIGVATGAILGILYAPDKGSNTRRKLSRMGDDLREKFDSLKDSINEKIEQVNEDTDDYVYHNIEADTELSNAPHSWQQ